MSTRGNEISDDYFLDCLGNRVEIDDTVAVSTSLGLRVGPVKKISPHVPTRRSAPWTVPNAVYGYGNITVERTNGSYRRAVTTYDYNPVTVVLIRKAQS